MKQIYPGQAILFRVSSAASTQFIAQTSTVGVSVTCRISPLKYSLTSVRNVLTSKTSSRWEHSLLNRVQRRWRKFLMKVAEVTVFSAGVPWGLCIVPETLNLALTFWSICIRVFLLSQCVARLLREMATRHDIECQNEGTINVFHYSDILYQSRYLGNKPDTFAACVNEKYCSPLRNYPCWVGHSCYIDEPVLCSTRTITNDCVHFLDFFLAI